MSWPTIPMTDDQLDETLATHLRWRSQQLAGAPTAQDMAWRIAGARFAARPPWQRALSLVVLAAMLTGLAGAAVFVASRPPAPIGPLENGPIVLANALPWRAIDPVAGVDVSLGHCEGLCDEAEQISASMDGRSLYLVDPTPTSGDLQSKQTGWAVWRWDRRDKSVSRIVGCDAPCQVHRPLESPDGRYLAFLETTDAFESTATVVVDVQSGSEVRRVDGAGLPIQAWDEDGDLIAYGVANGVESYYRIDVDWGSIEPVTLPADGAPVLGPHGRMAYADFDPAGSTIWIGDGSLRQARVLAELTEVVIAMSWAPAGTAIALLVQQATADGDLRRDLVVLDVVTGQEIHRTSDVIPGSLLWLPAD